MDSEPSPVVSVAAAGGLPDDVQYDLKMRGWLVNSRGFDHIATSREHRKYFKTGLLSELWLRRERREEAICRSIYMDEIARLSEAWTRFKEIPL
jgi:hypothetical protein